MNIKGLGGVFLKAQNPDKLYSWYEEHLGLKRDQGGGFFVPMEKLLPDYTLLSFFPVDSKYLSDKSCMLNFQVEDLDQVLRTLMMNGIAVSDPIEETLKGRFAWIFDPEGNKIELWEPPLYEGKTLVNFPEAD
jgi:predicted enzyme related to lactoylglutathione lyase